MDSFSYVGVTKNNDYEYGIFGKVHKFNISLGKTLKQDHWYDIIFNLCPTVSDVKKVTKDDLVKAILDNPLAQRELFQRLKKLKKSQVIVWK